MATNYDSQQKNSYACEMLKDVEKVTMFSSLFFSRKNIESIQKNIRYQVYTKSGKVINSQDLLQLLLIMRDIYITYGGVPNCTKDYPVSINKLNQKVLEKTVPSILKGIESYSIYLKDIDTIPVSSNQIHTSVKGTKQIREVSDVVFDNNVFERE
ncbi:MAG TPA: hypothetical protein V6C58_14200 [Allocoleopsis sp.]